MKKQLYLIFIPALFLFGCKAAEKEFRQGDYDQAIDISVKKLQRNPDKEAYILVLEEAFRRANDRDLAYINTLHMEGQPDRWDNVYNVYQGISRRQNKVAPLLPLSIESEYRDAEFLFVDVVGELIAAKKNAASYFYAHAQQLLATGDRYDARDAYYELQQISKFYNDYQDADKLMAEARAAGMSRVGFQVVNNSDQVLNRNLVDAMEALAPAATQGMWYNIYPSDKGDDLTVQLRINRLQAFPEQVHTNSYTDMKEVEDGWTYLYDDEGHVVKDSTGNAIKVPKYETITALISENWQEKVASIEAELRYLDQRGNVLKSVPLKGDGVFQNYFATATGYYDAISPESRQKLGGGPAPFPSNEALLLQAMGVLEGLMHNAMRDWNDDLLNR